MAQNLEKEFFSRILVRKTKIRGNIYLKMIWKLILKVKTRSLSRMFKNDVLVIIFFNEKLASEWTRWWPNEKKIWLLALRYRNRQKL